MEYGLMDLLATVAGIRNALILMAIVLITEAVVPLAKRTAWNGRHLLPNLVATLMTFALGALLNVGVLTGLVRLHAAGLGLFNQIGTVSTWIKIPAVLVALDFAWYLTHVSMHKSSFLWRFHAVPHSHPAVAVTTTYRPHPAHRPFRS